MPELLIELLSEEIPARMQRRATEDLKRLITDGLTKARLTWQRMDSYVTPRRLALVADGVPDRQPDFHEERKGPRVGAPEAAIQGFLRANGLTSLDQAAVQETDKGRFYIVSSVRPGGPARDALAPVLRDAIAALPWPKSMRWADTEARWVRPLHNILALFDGEPVALAYPLNGGGAALTANAGTRGHRFLAPEPFAVSSFDDYVAKLRAAKVILDQDERRRVILAAAEGLAASEGLTLKRDDALLDEVTGLVEWPVAMLGRIEERFLDIPQEVLITAMRSHQKYFSLLDSGGRLAPRFVVVANTETADGGAAVIAGNERVLRARLSDAKFFWDQDRKRPLESRLPRLKERVFHARLGSDFERALRLARLARSLAARTGADPDLAERAARLAKADLMSGMVGEFPELQGIMGRYYALGDGEPAEVAEAIADHYAPQGPSDRCPTAPVSAAAALADKIDTLVGFFAIGERPTGSGDPFALRRAALGVIRIILENDLRIALRPLFTDALHAYGSLIGDVDEGRLAGDLLAFFADRLKVHLKEQGVRHDLITAVFALGDEDDLVRLLARVDALKTFLNTEDGANLLTAYKRASNIVRIEEKRDGRAYDGKADADQLSAEQEQGLYEALGPAQDRIRDALASEHFADAMGVLAGLRAPVDAFFDHVQVNCPEAELRANRLRLLSQIRSALQGVADFSQVEG